MVDKSLENTVKAFSDATGLGYGFIETDVISTKDGEAICYHGAHNWYAKRLSGLELRRKLQKLTYDQIKQKNGSRERQMPLLGDVLMKFPQTCFSIDVKTKESISPVVQAIKKQKAQDRVIITSFSLYRTLRANRLLRGGHIEASLCLSRVSLWAIPPFNRFFFRFAKTLGIGYLQVSYRRITKRLVSLAHKQGLHVYAWTVNDEQGIKKMLSLGVDGIMSDDTKLLMRTVKNKKV